MLADPAVADCVAAPTAEVRVVMYGQRQLRSVVDTVTNGIANKFIFDTGADATMVKQSSSAKLGLEARDKAQVMSFGQPVEVALAEVKSFEFAGRALHRLVFGLVDVAVLDDRVDGFLGEREIGDSDLEIDLPGGVIRFFPPAACKGVEMAYWAKPNVARVIELEPFLSDRSRIFGTVSVNGAPLRAMFDTGTPTTLLTAKAAAKAGVTPEQSGVSAAGYSQGIGPAQMRAWTASFAEFSIGGESWPHPTLDFADKPNATAELLIGADFFKTHRVFISKSQHSMAFTYEGGQLFGRARPDFPAAPPVSSAPAPYSFPESKP